MGKITKAQYEALKLVVQKFDKANEAEITRWGNPLKGGVDITAGEQGDVRETRTLHVLNEMGLIELKSTVESAEKLRRGSYGKWIGGSKRITFVAFTARPTLAGRAHLNIGHGE